MSNRIREGGVYLKHSMSFLPDLPIKWAIDDESKLVVLTMEAFDSSLVAAAVMGRLHEDFGVCAWRDDSEKNELWMTKPAPYSIQANIAGVRYDVNVVRLFDTRRVSVALHPLKS